MSHHRRAGDTWATGGPALKSMMVGASDTVVFWAAAPTGRVVIAGVSVIIVDDIEPHSLSLRKVGGDPPAHKLKPTASRDAQCAVSRGHTCVTGAQRPMRMSAYVRSFHALATSSLARIGACSLAMGSNS